MKKTIIGIIIVIAAVLSIIIVNAQIKRLKAENNRLKNNQEVLLSEKASVMASSQLYRVHDSLNAAKVTELQFSLSEYKKYRKQDLELIKYLKKSNLNKIISPRIETTSSLAVALNDSAINAVPGAVVDTLKCFEYKSKWVDVAGCIKDDTAELRIINRESLKVIETIEYKRFLGFLWRTSKIKSRQVDVISENPATTITNVDYVSISHKQ